MGSGQNSANSLTAFRIKLEPAEPDRLLISEPHAVKLFTQQVQYHGHSFLLYGQTIPTLLSLIKSLAVIKFTLNTFADIRAVSCDRSFLPPSTDRSFLARPTVPCSTDRSFIRLILRYETRETRHASHANALRAHSTL